MSPELFGITSAILAIGIESRYLFSIVQKKTKPSFFGWLVIVTSMILVFLSSRELGGKYTLFLIGTLIWLHSIAVLLAWKYGYRTLETFDRVGLVLVVVGLGLWIFTHTPVYTLLLMVAIDAIGMSMIIYKTYKYPGTEDRITWGGSIVFYFLSLLSVSTWQIGEYLFLISNLITCSIIFGLSLRRSDSIDPFR